MLLIVLAVLAIFVFCAIVGAVIRAAFRFFSVIGLLAVPAVLIGFGLAGVLYLAIPVLLVIGLITVFGFLI